MKNRFSKILILILMLFSYIFVGASVNSLYFDSNKNINSSGFVPEEYVSYYDIKPTSILNYKRSFRASSEIIPSKYDLTNDNGKRLITEVKDQNPWGLCWAFSTNSMIESYHIKKYNKSYNFSENAPGYIGKYYGDVSSVSSGNTLFNAVKYWFLGNAPVSESVFGSYFTTEKSKNISDFLDNKNIEIDVQGVTFFDTLNMSDLKSKYTATQVKNIVEDYNKNIKSHILNNGAVSTGVYMDYMNYNTKFLYNSNSAGSGSEGHAVTIVGWDDNFGSVTINGTTLKGSWIVMNSWGESFLPYFYVSYYDSDIVNNIIGTTSSKIKEWNNVYNMYTRGYVNNSSKTVTYVYDKGNIKELLDNIKILYYRADELNINFKLSDGINTYDLGSKTISKGLTTINGNNLELSGSTLYLTLSSSDSKFMSYYPYIMNSVFTKSTSNNKTMELIGTKTNSFSNSVNNTTEYSVITKNITTGTNYSIKVYDSNNNDITSNFTIDTTSPLVNGVSIFELKLNKVINSKSIRVEVIIDGLNDSVSYYIQGNGTSSNPYIIGTSLDMKLLQTYPSAYFVLGNDIDMNEDTKTSIGGFYNNGKGWFNKNFTGTLDGKGYKISNFYSKDGGIFYNTEGNIKNLWIDNFLVNSSNTSGLLGKTFINGNISNIYITNSSVSNTSNAGLLFGEVNGGIISNIHMNSNSVYSSNISGGVSATMNPSNNISIMNVFIDNTYIMTNTNGISGKLVGNLIYEGDMNSLKNTSFSYNKVNSINNNSYKNASVMIEKTTSNVTRNGELISYNPYTNNITSTENNSLSSEEVKNKNNFNNYDFDNTWYFDDKPYLKLFFSSIIEDLEDVSILFKTYKINNDVIYGLVPNTYSYNLINDMIISDKLTYKIYNKNGSLLSNSDKLTTDSYILLSNGRDYKYYYIAIYGDVNGDGKASIADVYRIADYIIVPNNKKSEYLSSNAQLIAANVNKDSKISISDVYKVADYVINPRLGF